MRLDVTAQALADHEAGHRIDPDGALPAAVYRYLSDNPEDGIGPNGVAISLYPEVGRAAITGGGDWQWGDYRTGESADILLDRYLAGDWGDE